MPNPKIQQRYENFSKAFAKLSEVCQKIQDPKVSSEEQEIFRDSLIQRFEFTLELAKNLIRDILREGGLEDSKLTSPKDIVSEGFRAGLIDNYEIWFKMIKSRNLSSHTYDEKLAKEMLETIQNFYLAEFKNFNSLIKQKYGFGGDK